MNDLVKALRAGEQADMDGTLVKVSRQACEEAAAAIEALQAQLAEARDKALPALDMAAESLEWAIREMDEYASILSRERCTASRAAETTVEEVRDAIRAMKGERG